MVLNMKQIDEQKITWHILIGAGALLLLMFLMGMDRFSNFFVIELVWFSISSFFAIPIIKTITNKKIDRKDTVPFILGLIGVFFFSIVKQLTFESWCIYMLQTIVIITVLSLIITVLKEELRG